MNTLEIIEEMRSNPALAEELRAVLLSRELLALPERTVAVEDRLSRLEASVQALEASVQALQASVQALEASVQALAEISERHEASIARLSREIGRLSDSVGIAVEEAAAVSLGPLGADKGFEVIGEPIAQEVNGDGEVDLIASVRFADGHEASLLVEAKMRLRGRDVRRLVSRFGAPDARSRLAERGYHGPYLLYAYGEVVYGDAVEAAREHGIGIYGPGGDRYAIAVREQP